jgi:hypothetical protein
MRFLFHAMLALSLTAVAAGVALGAQARLADRDDADESAPPVKPSLKRAPTERVPVEETIAPPVPVSPRFAAEVSASPVLAWRLEEGTDGARVELCPTNDFDPDTTRRIDVAGDHVQLASALPPGIWYWHLRGRRRAYLGDRATPTWMLYVRGGEGATTSAQADQPCTGMRNGIGLMPTACTGNGGGTDDLRGTAGVGVSGAAGTASM